MRPVERARNHLSTAPLLIECAAVAAHSHTSRIARATASAAGEQPYAALDLGSNSFHLIVAHYRGNPSAERLENGGRLQVVDRHKEMVRLAAGLTANNELSGAAAKRALACLDRLGQRIRHLPSGHVRVVGTNTLRRARQSEAFITAAERALGHEIEIVSGREEARLIYLGVSHSLESVDDDESRLVVDIGGGSTEIILGTRFQPRLTESLYMGCVSMSARFFPRGKVTPEGFADAESAARQELEAVEHIYRVRGWDTAIGASGTAIAVHDAILELTGARGITRQGLAILKDRLLAVRHADALELEAVGDERAPVFPGGLAILRAIFDALGIDVMTVSDGALREGLLHDLLGRVYAQDIRETTVDDLLVRYHIDVDHARRVAATAAKMLEQASWEAPDPVRPPSEGRFSGQRGGGQLLRWGAMLHEIGMDIAHSQYHKHGGYLLDNMDLPGFSRTEQHSLSALVRAHRRKFPVDELRRAPDLVELCILLRLAVVLHRGRMAVPLPRFTLAVLNGGREIRLAFPAKWLASHPLTQLDLEQEADYLAAIPMRLTVVALRAVG